MKANVGVDAVNGDERSVSHTGHLTRPSPSPLGKQTPITHGIGGWVGSTAGVDATPSGNSSTIPGLCSP
jgi:hypothetical protein